MSKKILVYNYTKPNYKCFKDKYDYWRFLESMYLLNQSKNVKLQNITKRFEYPTAKKIVKIHAYNLRPSLVIILLEPKTENGVGKYMQKLNTSYTMYFNEKYSSIGSLYAGRYKKINTEDLSQKNIIKQIHRNPYLLLPNKVKEYIAKDNADFKKYPFSSYQDIEQKHNRLQTTILQS